MIRHDAAGNPFLGGELFDAVQRGGVFDDSKQFVDAVPTTSPDRIRRRFAARRDDAGFDLRAFVEAHFDVPPAAAAAGESDGGRDRSMTAHVDRLWSRLLREQTPRGEFDTLIPLPEPHPVPGGRFREAYYWDSYFVAEGLAASGRLDAVAAVADNFASLVERFGFVPNGNRTYYAGRSQLSLYAGVVDVLDRHRGADAVSRHLPALEAEHAFWMDGRDQVSPARPAHRRVVRLDDGRVLNRYWDDRGGPRPESYREDRETAAAVTPAERPALYRDLRSACESGWDFSSRWLADPDDLASVETTKIVPVDLNAALYGLEWRLADWFGRAGEREKARRYRRAAAERAEAIDRCCWDSARGFYADYHVPSERPTETWSLAAVAPLFFGASSEERAASVADVLERRFLEAGGLLTTLTRSGQQWDAPNGWAPLHWMAVVGLRRYGFDELAREIAQRWLALNRAVFEAEGRLVEKYDVTSAAGTGGGGEYPLQDGFGWTNGVAVALARLLGRERPLLDRPFVRE
ncbi:alpha,alpha-trehalase TreF [Halovivax sp.]|uniref:alpha,alpha-trehalase TreF n=1 Tax=Halovivax sp. TaxID=1935978 RepID=UPI0025BABB1A|nr:alpha,alpha-trehalase TreF [Halovivax sp.]